MPKCKSDVKPAGRENVLPLCEKDLANHCYRLVQSKPTETTITGESNRGMSNEKVNCFRFWSYTSVKNSESFQGLLAPFESRKIK